jgi:hypothetical protein
VEEQVARSELLRLNDRIRSEIMDYLNARRLLTAQIELVAPGYTWVRVEVVARQRKRADGEAVADAIRRRLYRYINPVYGGPAGDGRAFDEPLYLSEIYAIVQGIDGVENVESVRLLTVDPDTEVATPTDGVVTPPSGGLLASDTHEVTVK